MSWSEKYAKNNSVVKHLINQLSKDYPEDAMDWIKDDATWEAPHSVPSDKVDYSNSDSWRASKESEIVKKFEKKIKNGKIKPVVLLKTPKNNKYIVIDGHHRSLAYRNLGWPLISWVGKVNKENGPWDNFHNKQILKNGEDSQEREVK